jgi:hypothetical protein
VTRDAAAQGDDEFLSAIQRLPNPFSPGRVRAHHPTGDALLPSSSPFGTALWLFAISAPSARLRFAEAWGGALRAPAAASLERLRAFGRPV